MNTLKRWIPVVLAVTLVAIMVWGGTSPGGLETRGDLFRRFFTWNTTEVRLNTGMSLATDFADAGIVNVQAPTGTECWLGLGSGDAQRAICMKDRGGAAASGAGTIYYNTGSALLTISANAGNVTVSTQSGGTVTLGTGAAIVTTAGTHRSTVASGSKAFEATVNGARWDFGAGTNDYASSDGTTVAFAGPITTTVISLPNAFSTTAYPVGMQSNSGTTGGLCLSQHTADGSACAGGNIVYNAGSGVFQYKVDTGNNGIHSFFGALSSNVSLSVTGTSGKLFFNNAAAGAGLIEGAISAANAGATVGTAALKLYPTNALDATDWVLTVSTAANAASLFNIDYTGNANVIGALTMPTSGTNFTLSSTSQAIDWSNTSATGTGVFADAVSAANAGATPDSSAFKFFTHSALDDTDWILSIGTTLGSNTNRFAVNYRGSTIRPATDQSADCDNAATGNAPVGKVCVQAGQGSMVLTNSSIQTGSLVQLTNISDDATCLSGYATVGGGSATIGCVGAATATANTVFAFEVINE